jgi:hypothetical protein
MAGQNCGDSGSGKFAAKLGKGAVTRAISHNLLRYPGAGYPSVRYPGEIADNSKKMPKNQLITIIKWANQDKVDRWERQRNAEIQKVQGNHIRSVERAFSISSRLVRAVSEDALSSYHNTFLLALRVPLRLSIHQYLLAGTVSCHPRDR